MTTIYQLTRDELITSAIGKLGVLAAGQAPTTEDISKGAMALGMLVSFLRTKGIPLWSRKELAMPLQASTSSYLIGVGRVVDTPYPLKVLDAYVKNNTGNTRIPIDIIAKSEYNILPQNSSSGMPLKLSYQPFINYGELSVWPTPDSSVATNYTMTITYQEPFEYFTSGTSTMDFPEEYYLPIVYKLAVLLAPEWGVPLEDRRMLQAEAKEYMDAVDGFGEEDGNLFFSPSWRK